MRESLALVADHHLNFPQELVDLIVDALSDDRVALNACSLTCRAWTYRSQFRLHRHLRFTNVKHLTSNPSRYDDPVLAGYVHSLDISTLPTATSPYQSGERIEVWVILARLIQVRQLTIRSLEDAAAVIPFISLAFPSVTQLTLGKAEFDSFAQFKSFFASFTHLTHFQLEQFDIFPWNSDSEDEDSSEDEDESVEFPFLRHLTLSGRSLYSVELIDLAAWLRSELPGPYNLQSLTFETWYGGRFGTMKAYLAASRRSLQVLQLPMGACEPSIARLNFKRFGFRRLARLHTITFVAAENPWAMRHYTSEYIPQTLAQITSKCISRVSLDFSPARGSSFGQILDFKALDQALARPHFVEHLKFVDLVCGRGQANCRQAAEQAIREGLPHSVQRGIVRLDFGDFLLPILPLEDVACPVHTITTQNFPTALPSLPGL